MRSNQTIDANQLRLRQNRKEPRILIMNHFLANFTGSEIATLDLATEFLTQGYNVTVGTFFLSDPLRLEFNKLNIRCLDLNTASSEHYDIIYAHHFTTLDTCLIDIGITADRIIFSSLSPYEPLESPPLSLEHVNLFLANSNETRNALIEMGLDNASVEILPNPVASGFFDNSPAREFVLNNIAIISNHVPEEINEATQILKRNGVEVKIFGIQGEYRLITPEVLKEFDAAITIGRTVQYCLAMGIPVYCYDRFGGPGWIKESNIQKASEFNFSGRCTNRVIKSDEIANEIIQEYSNIQSEIDFYRKFAHEHYCLSNSLDAVLEKALNSPENRYSHRMHVYKNISKRQRIYFNSKLNSGMYSQLFIDDGYGFTEKNSIKLPVAALTSIEEFIFDLSDRHTITNIRLDPLNDSCVIEVISLLLTRSDGKEIDCMANVSANACSQHGQIYFFGTFDPQIRFNRVSIDNLDVKRFIARIRFVHIGKDAIKMCLDQIMIDKDHIIELQEHKLDRILTSFSWRCLERLRTLKRILLPRHE